MLLPSLLSSLIHVLLIIVYYYALHNGKAQQEEMRMEHSSIPSKSQTNLQSGPVQTVPVQRQETWTGILWGSAQAAPFWFCALHQRIVGKTAVTPASSML